MAQRVNQRAVELAQDRRERAAAAGITYEEQLAIDQKSGVEIGGQRGLAQALDANGNPLPGSGRQGGAGAPAQRPQPPATQTPPPAATPPAAPAPPLDAASRQSGGGGPSGRGRQRWARQQPRGGRRSRSGRADPTMTTPRSSSRVWLAAAAAD